MKLSIVGYGNLGKSLEKKISEQKDLELAAIYSRRNIDNAKFRPMREIVKDVETDVMLIALGSYSDVREHSEALAKFDTVDSFDTHATMEEYKKELTLLNGNRLALVGLGWDPGILSLIRGTFSMGNGAVTVWGKGISQGHSNAVRSIAGVIDAVQFTVPKTNCEELIEKGETDVKKLHDRVCYVACVEKDREDIERQIKGMTNYFEGYDVEVKFVSAMEVRELKKDTSHRGQVFCAGIGYKAKASITLDCNTELTAQIMLMYARIVPQLKKDGYKGALDAFDIPMRYVADKGLI